MGSPHSDEMALNHEKPQHQVTVKEFYFGKYPVTQAQYGAVMGKNPSRFKNNLNNPVERVSWNDAQEFCQKLNQQTGKQYRLPSEAEWEYACRAGTSTRYYFGDNTDKMEDHVWWWGNSYEDIHLVGEKRPNPWGLYDLHGIVWEWCEDKWHDNYEGAPVDGTARVLSYENKRVLRGGGWLHEANFCSSAGRDRDDPVDAGDHYGLRVAGSV